MYTYTHTMAIVTQSLSSHTIFCRHSIIWNSKYIYFFHRGMRKHWALNNYTNMSIDIQNCPQIMCAVGCCCCFFHLTVAVRFNSLSFVFFVFFEMLVWRLNVIRIVRQKWLSVKEWMKRREIQTKLRIQSKERERAGKRT